MFGILGNIGWDYIEENGEDPSYSQSHISISEA